MKTLTTSKLAAALGFAALALTCGPARADITLTLDNPNPAISTYAGPYGTATIHLVDTNTATITFDALVGPTNAFVFGDGGSVGFNVNAGSWTVDSITGSNSYGGGFTPGPYTDGGAGNEDGFGSFNQTINSFDGYTHSSTQIIVTFSRTSGTWATESDVLTNNASGFEVAAHIFVCDASTYPVCDQAVPNPATGFATTGGFPGGSNVLEPNSASLAVLALGLLGAGFWTRRKV